MSLYIPDGPKVIITTNAATATSIAFGGILLT